MGFASAGANRLCSPLEGYLQAILSADADSCIRCNSATGFHATNAGFSSLSAQNAAEELGLGEFCSKSLKKKGSKQANQCYKKLFTFCGDCPRELIEASDYSSKLQISDSTPEIIIKGPEILIQSPEILSKV